MDNELFVNGKGLIVNEDWAARPTFYSATRAALSIPLSSFAGCLEKSLSVQLSTDVTSPLFAQLTAGVTSPLLSVQNALAWQDQPTS